MNQLVRGADALAFTHSGVLFLLGEFAESEYEVDAAPAFTLATTNFNSLSSRGHRNASSFASSPHHPPICRRRHEPAADAK
jgi:hypothetical protein